MKKLPKIIYVAWHDLENHDPYLVAYTERSSECLEDDGPLLVGAYHLKSAATLSKIIKED